MSEQITNKLLSIHGDWVAEIFAGRKRIEYRRVQSLHEPGTWIWIYETSPTSSIVGYFIVERVEVLQEQFITHKYINHKGINRERKFRVPDGARAIHFDDVTRLNRCVTLEKLRELKPGFHPPQGHAVKMPQEFLDYIFCGENGYFRN